jgi:hypothetical protein
MNENEQELNNQVEANDFAGELSDEALDRVTSPDTYNCWASSCCATSKWPPFGRTSSIKDVVSKLFVASERIDK